MSTESHLNPLPSIDDAAAAAALVDRTIASEVPDAPMKLKPKEKKIWEHVTQALLEYGLIHRTDGLALAIICRTFVDWVEATQELEEFKKGNGGSYISESRNGYRTPHPLYYVIRDHKKSLLQWLPEAALTIPSFQKIKTTDGSAGQSGLFDDDPIEQFKKQKAAMGMRLVGGTAK